MVPEAGMSSEVVVFTAPGCRSCERAKAFLNAHGVTFVERSLAGDRAATEELVAIGARMLPVLRIGNEIISGFDPVRLSDPLGLVTENV
jgi:glutaredoxin-like protein NrdH